MPSGPIPHAAPYVYAPCRYVARSIDNVLGCQSGTGQGAEDPGEPLFMLLGAVNATFHSLTITDCGVGRNVVAE